MSAGIKEKVSEALKLHQSGDLIKAEDLYFKILNLCPDNADTLNLLGLLKLQTQQFQEAVFYIKKAIECKPCAYFYGNLGRAYSAQNNFYEAIQAYKQSLELEPNSFESLFNLALAYKSDYQYEQAIETYEKALEIKPNNADIYFNLGNIYENINDTQTALEYYKKAALYKKENNNNLNENIDYFLAVSYLKLKDFKNGWKHYEYRPSKEFSIRTQEHQLQELITTKPLWNGEDIKDKTLYIYYEAGLGDSIMYARYFSMVKEKCAKVLFKPQTGLANFFKDCNLGVEIIGFDTPKEKIIFDYHLPIMSIPYVLGLNTEVEIPFANGFLTANSKKVFEYKEKYFNHNKFKIGIKWQGNPHYDTNRIIPIEAFYKLFELPNTQFYSLQKDDGTEELQKLNKNYEIVDLGVTFNDFSDTAAAIENLDLVICNDTSVAHLVAAMGKPCWIMLPYVSNWRWHNNFKYSPWYKNVKLFKQTKLNSWDDAFTTLEVELNKIL